MVNWCLYSDFGTSVHSGPEYSRLVLAEFHRAAEMTQPQLTDFAMAYCSFLAAVEIGRIGFSLDVLYQLLSVLKFSPTDFFMRVEEVRARKPVLTKLGRGKQPVVTFNEEVDATEIC